MLISRIEPRKRATQPSTSAKNQSCTRSFFPSYFTMALLSSSLVCHIFSFETHEVH
ncbi:hypothetical protein K435DRAFT_404835 [Dendrothele bispora CBS 962.96]|uniref:Uncharacterized protein n=1 Tax=Dendrothele bispora (strain CBS 962.96) TaxID=1314807 RepID=A0A4S8L7B1_DENBC|nr:hypothetical protein K435DRAFT_404835 [Dendrothele bispora CBS 962.96]